MNVQTEINISRRWFLASVGGALLATGFLPKGAHAEVPSIKGGGSEGYSPTIWYVVRGDGRIIVHVPLAEMGQHVGTAVARLVAEELEAKWDDIDIVHVDHDPKWGYMITGGSWSVNHSYLPFSRAGAAGRIALIEAGAKMLGVSSSDCIARDSEVRAGTRSVSYGEIAVAGSATRVFTAKELEEIKLKPATERRLLNKDITARDIPAKVDGSAIFGIDRHVPDMVYARPVVPPTRYGSRIVSWSDDEARKVPGYLKTVEINDPSGICQGWLVSVAENWPAASNAADLVDVKYEAGPAASAGEADVLAEGHRLAAEPGAGSVFYQVGEPVQNPKDVFEGTYVTGSVLQMPLEPLNALVWNDGDKWRVHASDQHPSITQPLIAKALEVDPQMVQMETSYLGGGFGRRLFCEYTVPAALTAKAMGRPVKLLFSRIDDSKFCQPRSPSVQVIRTATDENGSLKSYQYRGVAGWPTKMQNPAALSDAFDGKGKIDLFAISGSDPWYDIPHQDIRTISNELAESVFLPGYLRSVGPGFTYWALETHIDEVAHRLGRDPAEYRRSQINGEGRNAGEAPHSVDAAARLKNVLDIVVKKTNWDKRASLPDGEGLGIAIAAGQERTMPTWSATVAHVAVDRKTGQVSVKRLTSVVDAGTLAHPNGALAQIEGGMLWGLSITLHEGTEFENGLPRDLNFDTYTPVRILDVPEIDIEFVQNDHLPVGLGEPGVITVGPAIGNAIFDAVGARVRSLPIRPEAIIKALEA
ncbi:molybdopterin cofactor-binding domain-containing protein [Rhizobium johnstonii]|jgi:CO/xanthine dehydrogenase Mo-binding subunit|uniref:xanthine dehydrogenase family protein molybdopterin-binding subunit n=1 Tax=Rhizobium TaxID=379 RepID=UPI00140FCBB8|nr:molybdopterin cofactor-binding domain-containing protein [Rhizobium leguminosarum]QIO63988.1 molybdopterin-dependent oxidoreductase [Rhizobium leguminosarum bv. trifolii]